MIDPMPVEKPKPVHDSKYVLGAMVRHGDAKAIRYVLRMIRFHRGNVTGAAKDIGVTQRVIYKWAGANPEFKELLRKVARGVFWESKISDEAVARIRKQKGKKTLTELAAEEGLSESGVSLIQNKKRRARRSKHASR
jgi:DNA-binding phage protein